MLFLKLILGSLILYVTYQGHLPQDLGVTGLNVLNLLFLLALALMVALGIKARTPAPLKGALMVFFAMLVFSFVIGQIYDGSTMWDDATALKNSVFYMLLYFLFYHAVHDEKTIRRFFVLILAIAALASIEMLHEAIDYGIGSYKETHRVAGPFGPWNYRQANRAAAYLLMFVPIFATIAMLYRSKVSVRLVALGCLVLSVTALFFTGSRQAYVIVALLIVLVGLRSGCLPALVAVVLVLGYESWVPDAVIERFQMTQQSDDNGDKQLDESTESRFVQWSGAMQIVRERPWGIGLNHFKLTIGDYSGIAKLDAHNFYVLLLTEAGIQGLIAFLVVLYRLYRLGRHMQGIAQSEFTKVLGFGYLTAVFAMMLGNVFGSRFFDGDVMGNFWILSALVARYGTLAEEAASQAPDLSQAQWKMGAQPVR